MSPETPATYLHEDAGMQYQNQNNQNNQNSQTKFDVNSGMNAMQGRHQYINDYVNSASVGGGSAPSMAQQEQERAQAQQEQERAQAQQQAQSNHAFLGSQQAAYADDAAKNEALAIQRNLSFLGNKPQLVDKYTAKDYVDEAGNAGFSYRQNPMMQAGVDAYLDKAAPYRMDQPQPQAQPQPQYQPQPAMISPSTRPQPVQIGRGNYGDFGDNANNRYVR